MMHNRFIRPTVPEDLPLIERLHNTAFGPGRFVRAAYRVREQARGAGFGLTAWRADELAGSVQFTPVTIGGLSGAVLLGPLAVAPRFAGQGYGRWLVREGLDEAKARGATLVILVGDLPYYALMGFERVPAGQITLPGPIAPDRLLARELQPGAITNYKGALAGDAGSNMAVCLPSARRPHAAA